MIRSRGSGRRAAAFLMAVAAAAGAAEAQTVRSISDTALPGGYAPLPMHVGGRVQPDPAAPGLLLRQWPGTYFETAFDGDGAVFRVGPGDVHLKVSVDGGAPVSLLKPRPGLYRVGGLSQGPHRLRVDVASESQAEATAFGGFYRDASVRPLPPPRRDRQIEFIGDSHTAGYGNVSARRACSEEEVWATTDTARGIAPLTAARYGADYRVHAISGRGIVRNYNGTVADTLPQAHPFLLLDKAVREEGPGWSPDFVVIALGTNDFSTPLNPGEKWQSRAALHADFETGYVRFVESLRVRYPHAWFLLWATDLADGEIEAAVGRVTARLHAAGERRLGFVPIGGLGMTGCHFHPDLADDARIAAALAAFINAHPQGWQIPPAE